MSDILFIKTSSLGDVIHHMPALTEARRRLPGARFSWVVEEAFAPLVALHPAVVRGHPGGVAALARRAHAPSTWREMVDFSPHASQPTATTRSSTPRGCCSNRR